MQKCVTWLHEFLLLDIFWLNALFDDNELNWTLFYLLWIKWIICDWNLEWKTMNDFFELCQNGKQFWYTIIRMNICNWNIEPKWQSMKRENIEHWNYALSGFPIEWKWFFLLLLSLVHMLTVITLRRIKSTLHCAKFLSNSELPRTYF